MKANKRGVALGLAALVLSVAAWLIINGRDLAGMVAVAVAFLSAGFAAGDDEQEED